jgi:hypothetical protein
MVVVLITDSESGLTQARVRLRDRLSARLHSSELDAVLSSATVAESTVPVALHAQRLVAGASRRTLVGAIDRLLGCASGERRASGVVPVYADRMRACSGELREIRDVLASSGPVAACGVAKMRLLVSDAASPLYARGRPDELSARLRDVRDALDPMSGLLGLP